MTCEQTRELHQLSVGRRLVNQVLVQEGVLQELSARSVNYPTVLTSRAHRDTLCCQHR
jgi:hypothetical protein